MALEKLVTVLTAQNSPHLDGVPISGYDNRRANFLWGIEIETTSNRWDISTRSAIEYSRRFELVFEDPKSWDFYCCNTENPYLTKRLDVYQTDRRYKIFGTEAKYKRFMSNLNQALGRTVDNDQYLKIWRTIQQLEKEYSSRFLDIIPQFIRTFTPAYFYWKISRSKSGTANHEIKQIADGLIL